MNCYIEPRRRRLALAVVAACSSGAAAAQHDLEEVIVTGTPREQDASELAQSVTVVSEETLDRVGGPNLGETLEGQLGVSASYFGAGASRPIIRGLAGARVRMMEDGVDSMDVSTVSADHAVGIDPLVAEQIEIFRGPTTLLYGSGAVGGVVNTVTNRIPEGPPADGLDASMEVRADSVANERTAAFALDGGTDRFAWHADAARRDTDDYEIPGAAELARDEDAHEADESAHEASSGLLENSDLELTSYALGGAWLGERALLGVAVSGFETRYGIPGHGHDHEHEGEGEGEGAGQGQAEAEPKHGEGPVRIHLDQTRVDLKAGWLDVTPGIEALNVRLGVNDYEHLEIEGGEVGTLFTNDAYEARVELLHAPFGAWSGAFGVQIGEREFAAIGDEAFVPPVDTRTLGVFALEQRELARWDVSLGARYETQEHVPADAAAVDGAAVSLSAAAIRRIAGGYSIALNLASAERLPAAEELFANGPHLASGVIERGNAALGTEAAQHLDIGVRKAEGDLSWSITAFRTDYDDFIFLRNTGAYDIDEDLPIFEFDQRDAKLTGLEAELFRPVASIGAGELDLRLFGDYVRAKLDDGENVPRIPPLRFGARLAYHADRFAVGLEATRYRGQNDVAPFETPTAGYTLVGADLRWSWTRSSDADVTLFVRGSNLLDEDARRHSSLVKDIAPLPGRNYSIGLRATF